MKKFVEINSESTLLDSELEALRGGAEGINAVCDAGLTLECRTGRTSPIE